MPLLTELKTSKGPRGRVAVYLDYQFAFTVDLLTAARLRPGQHLSETEALKLREDFDRDRAYGAAVRYLSYRPRSREEVGRYLRRKGTAAAVITETIQRLEQERYLDDEAFARFWIDSRTRFKPRSRYALRFELRQKGIAAALARSLTDALDDRQLARRAVATRLERWSACNHEEFRRRMLAFLQRRGFHYDIAAEITRTSWSRLNGAGHACACRPETD